MQGWPDVAHLWRRERRHLLTRLFTSLLVSIGVLVALQAMVGVITSLGFDSLPIGDASAVDRQTVLHLVTVVIGLVGSSIASAGGRWYRLRLVARFVHDYRAYVSGLPTDDLPLPRSVSETPDPTGVKRRAAQQERATERARLRLVDATARTYSALLDVFAGLGALGAVIICVIVLSLPGLAVLVTLMTAAVVILSLSFWNTNVASGALELAADDPVSSRYLSLMRQEAWREVQAPLFAATAGAVILGLALFGHLIGTDAGGTGAFLIVGFVVGTTRGLWSQAQQVPRSIGRGAAALSGNGMWDE